MSQKTRNKPPRRKHQPSKRLPGKQIDVGEITDLERLKALGWDAEQEFKQAQQNVALINARIAELISGGNGDV